MRPLLAVPVPTQWDMTWNPVAGPIQELMMDKDERLGNGRHSLGGGLSPSKESRGWGPMPPSETTEPLCKGAEGYLPRAANPVSL
jgi:hypothetical protein